MRLLVEYVGHRSDPVWEHNGVKRTFWKLASGKRVAEAVSEAHYRELLTEYDDCLPFVASPGDLQELALIEAQEKAEAQRKAREERKRLLREKIAGLDHEANRLKIQGDKVIAEAEGIAAGQKATIRLGSEARKELVALEAVPEPKPVKAAPVPRRKPSKGRKPR